MAKTEVILTSNIVGLGAESDQVKVSAGYARNFLFPQRLAIPLTGANKRRLEVLRQRRAEREAHDLNSMSELSKSLQKLICVMKVKTGEDGKMFGAVTSGMIADELKTQFDVSLDKRKIHLDRPLHALGDHDVELHLHPDVKGTLKVRIESTTPLPAPAPAPDAGAKKEEARGGRFERRGGRPVRSDRPTRTEGAERKPAEGAKPARPDRVAKSERTARSEKAPKIEKPIREDKAVKEDKAQ